jgi:hypothetical protein
VLPQCAVAGHAKTCKNKGQAPPLQGCGKHAWAAERCTGYYVATSVRAGELDYVATSVRAGELAGIATRRGPQQRAPDWKKN